MAKKKGWFNLVKRFFVSESQSKQEKKEKRRKWVFGRFKIKRLALITGPTQLKERTPSEEGEEQSKHVMTDDIATVEYAESAHPCLEETKEILVVETQIETIRSTKQNETEIQESSAIKIQTAFRGYLARKALRALKGIVKLQAIIRGRAVRHQAITTLKYLQSMINIQSKVCARRIQTTECNYQFDDNNQLQDLEDNIIKVVQQNFASLVYKQYKTLSLDTESSIKMDSNSQRRWDDSLMSKEEANSMSLKQKEAAIKRERIKEYSYIHRKSAESERDRANGRFRDWLEKWVDNQVAKSFDKEEKDLDKTSASKPGDNEFGGKQLRLKHLKSQSQNQELESPVLVTRRSYHHRRQRSLGDENSLASSPIVVPTYMVATESAKAKARSISNPKIRPGNFDTYSESYSPCKNKLLLISSVNSEQQPNNGWIGRSSGCQQRSPSMKGVKGPIKSCHLTKDLSIDSECSFPYLDKQNALG